MSDFSHIVSTLSHGILPTVELTVGGIVLCTVDAFAFGLLSLNRHRWVRFLTRVWVEGWRGTSELVQLFWVYFAVPLLIGFQIVPIWAGIVVLGLNNGAYGAEIVRGAVQSVPRAQHEGSVALGFSPFQRMRLVILPQAVVEMVPPFNTLFIQLLKATSLASLINVTEITYQGKVILEPTYSNDLAMIFGVMLVMYLILSVIITIGMRILERVLGRRVGRTPSRRVRRNAEAAATAGASVGGI